MKIGLFGHGKMGRMVESLAKREGLSIVDPMHADVCIDFSHFSVVLEHIRWGIEQRKSLVIGTTGWEGDLPAAQTMVQSSQIGVISSANFSLGMAHFLQLLAQTKRFFPHFEVAGIEWHHSQKVDAPSGSAKTIAERLKMETPFSSIRCGAMPGRHTVIFDSPLEQISLTHEAHTREGFASGALQAAAWILRKKGWYTLDDMLRNLHCADHPL